MKTRLHLGLAFVDSYGSRRLSFQLMPVGGRAAIANADFAWFACERKFFSANLPQFKRDEFLSVCRELADATAVKSLEWSYPTSGNAEAFGHGAAGCWTAHLGVPGKPSFAVMAFAGDERARALDYVRGLPFPWSEITLRVHPEYAEQEAAR